MKIHKFIVFLAFVYLAGCSSILNVGDDEYACKGMPEGTSCMSAAEVYAATEGDNYKTQLRKEQEGKGGDQNKSGEPVTRVLYANGADNPPIPARARNPLPIRSHAIVLGIAVDPWEDENGDLYVPGFIYTEIEPRRWEIGSRQPTQPLTMAPLNQ